MSIYAIRSGIATLARVAPIAPLKRSLVRYFHQSTSPMVGKGLAERARSFRYGPLLNAIVTAGVVVVYLINRTTHEENELFRSVDKGDFEKAKRLIESGLVDINAERKFGESSWVLLESFYPKTEEDLDRFMEFADFVLSRGYKHLNHPISGKPDGCNLLSNIYNRHIFKDDQRLRRKLIVFLLQRGVDPLHKESFYKSPLAASSSLGDAKFFIKACDTLHIPIFLEVIGDADTCLMLDSVVYHGHIDDLVFLLERGMSIGTNKPRLLALLDRDNRNYTDEKFNKVKEILNKA